MKTHDVKQGSPEWLALRLGIPTASEFDSLISPEWKARTGEGPRTYLYEKVCAKILGFAPEASSWAMEQGSLLENEAIPYFEFTTGIKVDRVGFCTTDDGRIGCSPDGLIGDDGGIEAKCPQPAHHLRYLAEGVVPKAYLAQVHGSMYVTGRPWWYFLSYSRQFPALVLRVERDPVIQDAIHAAIQPFLARFDELHARIKALRDSENAQKTAAYEAANQP